tara:strand:- start:116 stop:241 length:126 start_codon:yes stop_codon:yes gene_type:complete
MFTDPETQKSIESIPGKLAILKLPSANNKIHHALMQFKGRN